MKKYEMLLKQRRVEEEAHNTLEAEISNLHAKIDDLNAQVESAAANGDYDAFKRAKSSLQDVRDDLEFKTAQMNRPTEISKSDVLDAWADYREDHEKYFARMLKKYEGARAEFARLYCDLVESQNAALHVRDDLNALLRVVTGGEGQTDLFFDYYVPNYTDRFNYHGHKDPDLAFSAIYGDLDADRADYVLNRQKAV